MGETSNKLEPSIDTNPPHPTSQPQLNIIISPQNTFYVTGDRSATFITQHDLRIELKAGGLSQEQEDHVISHILQSTRRGQVGTVRGWLGELMSLTIHLQFKIPVGNVLMFIVPCVCVCE